MVLNSLYFCCSEKFFISPSILNEIFAVYSDLGCRFFPFSILNIACHSLLACRVSAERSAVKHVGFPFYVTFCFSLATFNIFSLCLVFVSLVSMCLDVFLLGFILYGTLCASWTWSTIFFSMLGKFSTLIPSKNFLYPFFFSSVEGINSRISEAEEWTSELEDKMVEITYEEKNKVKRMKRTEDSLRDLWDNINCTNIQIIGVPEEEEKKKGYEKNF